MIERIIIEENRVGDIKILSNGCGRVYIGENSYFVWKNNLANSLDQDKVIFDVVLVNDRLEALVKSVKKRNKTQFPGEIVKKRNKLVFKPDDRKITFNFKLVGDYDYIEGQKVLVEIVNWKVDKPSPNVKVVKVLGQKGDNECEMNAIMYEFGLPNEFPTEVIDESNDISDNISDSEINSRLDLRKKLTVGIDPHDAKDADDTLSYWESDGFKYVSVNIADVSYYIKPSSEIDKEAYKRGNSVYLVDRVIPMIPHRLSNDICSLKSGMDKLTVSVIIKFDVDNNIVDRMFSRTIINVDKDYAYEDAQDIIENGSNNELEDIILKLDNIAKDLRKERINKGSVELNSKEVKFILDGDQKKPIGVYLKVQKDSNKLIEEFMLLANKEVAKFIKKDGFCVNRIHENPNIDKIANVQKTAISLGYEFEIQDDIRGSLNKLLKDIKGTDDENLLSNLVIRAQQKASYSTRDIPHFGLNFEDYAHFTSPIRRYSDLIVHRLLLNKLK